MADRINIMDQHTRAHMQDVLARQQAAHLTDPTPSRAVRIDRLDRLMRLSEQASDAIVEAISADFGHRSRHETLLAELSMTQAAIINAKRHVRQWMKPQRVKTPLAYQPSRNILVRQPLGVVGVVSPWNYPYQLSIGPAICALAAGNRVMIKPSELTPRFAALLHRLISEAFAPEEMAVITGDADVAQDFVSLPFDHLVFTGSTAVGRKVAEAAARNLTPVTLELGGKSPAILDVSADLNTIMPRLAFAKLINAGQTCIAPDYLMVPNGQGAVVAEHLRKAAQTLYPDAQQNPDYTSIINARHHQRLQGLLDDAQQHGAQVQTLVEASQPNTPNGKMMPTVVLGVRPDMRIMQEEIFGPILPIMEYDHLDDAISYINARERPLALYWFGQDKAHQARVLAETISGGVTINDCIWHFGQETQPFGGVGASGQGAYHGEWGFRAFSKEKPVFIQSRLSGIRLLYPPYGKIFARMLIMLKIIA
jgi:coniferyl-aldehyde dehydrogenase